MEDGDRAPFKPLLISNSAYNLLWDLVVSDGDTPRNTHDGNVLERGRASDRHATTPAVPTATTRPAAHPGRSDEKRSMRR